MRACVRAGEPLQRLPGPSSTMRSIPRALRAAPRRRARRARQLDCAPMIGQMKACTSPQIVRWVARALVVGTPSRLGQVRLPSSPWYRGSRHPAPTPCTCTSRPADKSMLGNQSTAVYIGRCASTLPVTRAWIRAGDVMRARPRLPATVPARQSNRCRAVSETNLGRRLGTAVQNTVKPNRAMENPRPVMRRYSCATPRPSVRTRAVAFPSRTIAQPVVALNDASR